MNIQVISDLSLTEAQLATLKTTYCLFGKFDYGLTFDPNEIPVSHMAFLLERFCQWTVDVNQTDPKHLVDLYVAMTGNQPEFKPFVEPEAVHHVQHNLPPRRHTSSVPTQRTLDYSQARPSPAISGEIDYAAAVNSMLEGNAR